MVFLQPLQERERLRRSPRAAPAADAAKARRSTRRAARASSASPRPRPRRRQARASTPASMSAQLRLWSAMRVNATQIMLSAVVPASLPSSTNSRKRPMPSRLTLKIGWKTALTCRLRSLSLAQDRIDQERLVVVDRDARSVTGAVKPSRSGGRVEHAQERRSSTAALAPRARTAARSPPARLAKKSSGLRAPRRHRRVAAKCENPCGSDSSGAVMASRTDKGPRGESSGRTGSGPHTSRKSQLRPLHAPLPFHRRQHLPRTAAHANERPFAIAARSMAAHRRGSRRLRHRVHGLARLDGARAGRAPANTKRSSRSAPSLSTRQVSRERRAFSVLISPVVESGSVGLPGRLDAHHERTPRARRRRLRRRRRALR